MNEKTFEPGTRVGDRYEVTGVLGAGAMATVYAAQDDEGGRVALKVLSLANVPREHHAEARARLLREAATARLQHPHIVPVLDAGVDDATDVPYLVMPIVEGGDLGLRLERTGALSPSVAVRLVLQAGRGLGYAHEAGVVHRDIKPSNLLLERCSDGTLRLRIADFGLAKAYREVDALTASGAFLGTPSYVAPEQAMSAKHADERSDVWSLAMVLYHALAGRAPYNHAAAFLRFFVGREPHVPHLQDVAPWVEPKLARVVHGGLLREADARVPSVGELSWLLLMCVGYDASVEPVRDADLIGVAPEQQAIAAQRAVLPAHWSELQRG